MDVCAQQAKKDPLSETGTYWVCTLLESHTRLRAGYGVGSSEGDAAQRLWRRWRWRLGVRTPPPLVSDGWGGQREALLEVFGRRNVYGDRRWAGKDWQYVQVHKIRDDYWRVVRLYTRWVWGQPGTTPANWPLTTAHVERTHLTSRLCNARLVRRTLAFSKSLSMLIASVIWNNLIYNLARPLKSLRWPDPHPPRRWLARSPAMAAGLTDHIWSITELLLAIPIVSPHFTG